MKKFVLKITLITLFVGALFINTSNAQPINIGGGIVIGTSYPHFGLKVNGTYGMDFLLENLSASAAFTFFIPSTPGVVTYNRWAIDIDGHYKFFTLEKFDFYALAGINLASYSTKIGTVKDPSFKPGVNAGAGALFGITENIRAFGEFKYIMGILDQAEITIGVLFAL
jgi:hypothetical protein